MAEADDLPSDADDPQPETDQSMDDENRDAQAGDPDGEPSADGERHGMGDTADFAAALTEAANAPAHGEDAGSSFGMPDESADAAPAKPSGPGAIVRGLRWLIRWHPLLFLSTALGLAGYAYMVYPEPESRQVPPAESFYYDGLDRIYRVINPDLPLIADTPADEALAARNAFLNLFVLYRDTLRDYPQFVNPHLLLAEANRILAEFNPIMADKYWSDARDAYQDAAVWENRAESPERRALYYQVNYGDGRPSADIDVAEILSPDNDEIVLRRQRRNEYIDFRAAEAEVNLNRPELARGVLEELRRAEDGRIREELRLSAQEESPASDIPRRAFELGPDDYRQLDLLLARTYDGLSDLPRAKGWYLRYLTAMPSGRNHAFVVGRLAEIAMQDGEVYRRANPEEATKHFQAAANFYQELLDSPSSDRNLHDRAVLGLARANSRLAGLVPAGATTGVDELAAVGRTLRGWLEEFSGQPLPRRTLRLPEAVGSTLADTEMIWPGRYVVPGVTAGSLAAMAGGLVTTPHEQRRRYLSEALENYDRIAASQRGSEAGDNASVLAAREAWRLGLKNETEARFERMLDPLSRPDLILAARQGLATVALDRGELRRAHMLILGGYAHPAPVWFNLQDADWRRIAVRLGTAANRQEPGVYRRLWEVIPEEGREIAGYAASGRRLDDEYVNRFLRNVNSVLRRRDLYVPEDFPPLNRNFYLTYLLNRDPELLTNEDVVWRNRLLFEEALPYDLAQRAARDNIGFEPFPPGRELTLVPLVDAEQLRDFLLDLARAWARASALADDRPEQIRMLKESNTSYLAALDRYQADPGDILYELAGNYETLANLREMDGNHQEALSLTAAAARSYLDVSLRARGSPREMDALLAAGDAFFRSGLLERTVESQLRFLDRFGYSATTGTDAAMAVVRAENLLGRAYWFLGDLEKAMASFRRNIPRRTPDRYKSIYYIGRMLMDEGIAKNLPELLGSPDDPLPDLDRNGDPVVETALQAFNFLRQDPGINPIARAWRWATFDLAKLHYIFAENARRQWEAERQANPDEAGDDTVRPWLLQYDQARVTLTEALERYPLRRNGGVGISIRVEPEDYADTMAARFATEFYLANTILTLADANQDDALYALARAHLENMRDRNRYASALFDTSIDRFQLNSAIIAEEIMGGTRDRDAPLPRTRLGDDEGPTHSPDRLRDMLRNSMLLLANEYFKSGEKARERQLLASTGDAPGMMASPENAQAYYQDSYRVWQDIYDRFGAPYGSQSMLMMGDCLNRLGFPDDAANHYRMAVNIAELMPEDTRSDGLLDIGPQFWSNMASNRLRDMADGYTVP